MHREIVTKGELFYRRWVQFISPAGGFVRLRPDRDDLVIIVEQAPQRRHRGFRRAHENDAHSGNLLYCYGKEKERGQARLPDLRGYEALLR